tara:strand:+ start:148 stop:759 length:612 start_codon:yes stop_codon:yes gene_type:complete
MKKQFLLLLFITLLIPNIYYGQSVTTETKQTTPKNKDSIIYNNFTPIRLAGIDYNKKAISQIGFGKVTKVSTSRDTNKIFAISYSTSRWWINKYFAGGWFYDMAPNKDGGYAIGPQITGFAELDEFFLPYCTIASGFGFDVIDTRSNTLLKSKLYVPFILKIGGYVFFKKNRGFALFAEINKHFNDENWPIYRVGVAWSKLKR